MKPFDHEFSADQQRGNIVLVLAALMLLWPQEIAAQNAGIQPSATAAAPAALQATGPAGQTTAPPAAAGAPAELADGAVPPNDLLAELQQRIATAEIDSALRDRLLEQANGIAREIAQADEHRKTLAPLRNRMETIAAEAESLRNPPPAETAAADLTEIETAQLETQLATQQLRLTEEQQRLTALQQRLSEINTSRQALQSQVTKLTADLAALPVAATAADLSTLPLEQAVTGLEQMVRRTRLRGELNLSQTRLSLLDAESSLGLFQLRVTGQERLLVQLSKNLTELREELEIRRRAESEARLRQAQRAQQQVTDRGLRELVARMTEVAQNNNQLVQDLIPQWQEELKRRSQQLERIREDGDKLKSRIDRFGTSGVVGVELLRYHQNLPSSNELEAMLDNIEQQQTRLEFERLDLADELRAADAVLEKDPPEISADARTLWSNKVALLRSVIANNSTLFSILADLNAECRTLLSVISTWEDYVSVQALWFPSHSLLTWSSVPVAIAELQQLGSGLWEEWLSQYSVASYRTWGVLLPDLLIMVALLVVQRRARQSIAESSERAARRACVHLAPTVKAILMTLIVAALWPVLLALLGTTLRILSGARTLNSALSEALTVAGFWLLLISFLRQILRPAGVAESHFDWDPAVCRSVRRWLHKVVALLAVPGLLYWFLRAVPLDVTVSQRLTFILLMLLTEIMICLAWPPAKSEFTRAALVRMNLFHRLRWVWIVVALLFPVGLACLSIAGYHYTATVLARRLVATVSVSAFLLLIHALLERWLKVRRRRAAIELARERAAQRERALMAEAEASEAVDSTVPPTPLPETDFEVLGVQARALIRYLVLIALGTIVWAIWYEVLPALRVLSEHELWSISEEVSTVVTGTDGTTTTGARVEKVPITFGNLMFAALTGMVMMVSVRFLPGFLEVLLLSRVAFDAGLRYAIINVARYLLLLAGVILICQSLGIRWNNVQWLAAGLSVGLGFGLQEVFANFVSGLIILFERPIRIGDIVTIDGVTGVVSRIRIRATSITDWDRREYIVPNKEFVTGRLLNWTLTDTTNRFVVEVGVAYGTDTTRAREILVDVARSHPNILKEPAPVASFEGFGDSALLLMLRVFMPSMENRLSTITDLHTEINRRFAEEGIDIPFPQRTLHMAADARKS